MRIWKIASAALAALMLAAPAAAQQPAAPAFAPSDLSPAGARALASNCAGCHGTQGHVARDSSVVGLAGMPRDWIVEAMKQFKDGKKPATVMHQIAKGYTNEEIAAMADYFSKLAR